MKNYKNCNLLQKTINLTNSSPLNMAAFVYLMHVYLSIDTSFLYLLFYVHFTILHKSFSIIFYYTTILSYSIIAK